GPVELDAAGDPRPGEPDQRRFDHPVVVDKVIAVGFVQGHLHPAAEFGQEHNAQIGVLQEDGSIRLVRLRVGYAFDDGIGIDDAAAALVDALLQEHRVPVRLADLIGRNRDDFFPGGNSFRQRMIHDTILYWVKAGDRPGASARFSSAAPLVWRVYGPRR